MKVIAIIPARYASTRFPGKPLADILGKSMIQRVYEQVLKASAIHEVWVATDDERIFNHLKDLQYNVVYTSTEHQSGTDRIAEAVQNIQTDIVLNVQGDEPFIHPEQINQLANLFIHNPTIEIGTLVKKTTELSEIQSPNIPKVAIAENGKALYFSRSPIPYPHTYYKHIGMYGFKKDTLLKLAKLTMGKLELLESLEQLRWLENGYAIHTLTTEYETIAIDTPEDLKKGLTWLEKNNVK
jgi:3-deoxy-manno-octulosonate cytidylyltransferase (CMP-KDO synthetase)